MEARHLVQVGCTLLLRYATTVTSQDARRPTNIIKWKCYFMKRTPSEKFGNDGIKKKAFNTNKQEESYFSSQVS